jgi:plastocyanin
MSDARTKTFVGTVMALVSAFVIVPPAAAGVAATLEVQVGAPLFAMPEARNAPADGMRFYTPPLNVHRGDTVEFVLEGFHTATLIPANTDADAWVAANAGDIAKPFSLITLDPDEGPGGVKFNNDVLMPVPRDCGRPANPCDYDGSSVVNSGVFNPEDLNQFPTTFSTTINANPGDVVTMLCLVHINMRQTLTVVPPQDAATTQAEIDEFRDRRMRMDARQASRKHRELLDLPNSGRVVDAFAGFDGPGYALDAFYPDEISIREGRRVRWSFDHLIFEDHTVTFPLNRGLRIANRSFLPVCDPDGDGGTAPDEPADFNATTLDAVCPGGAEQVEFDIHPKFGPPAGDGVVTSRRDFESSGIRGANVTDPGAYTLRFVEASGKPYTFVCMIHPFMTGVVNVA